MWEANTLLPPLHQRVTAGSAVCSDTFSSYTGIAAGGYIHRLSIVWRYNHRHLSGAEQPKHLLKLLQSYSSGQFRVRCVPWGVAKW